MKTTKEINPLKRGASLLLLFFILVGLMNFLLNIIFSPPEITYEENKGMFIDNMYFLSIPLVSVEGDGKNKETIKVNKLFNYMAEHEDFQEYKFEIPIKSDQMQFYIPIEKIGEAKTIAKDWLRSKSGDPGELKLITHDDTKQIWELSYWTTFSHLFFKYEATKNSLTPISYIDDNFGRTLRHIIISIITSFILVLISYFVVSIKRLRCSQ